MLYPTLKELNTSREMVDVFKGYNHNLRIGEGEFFDMKNLSSDSYPVLSPRPKRGIYATPATTPESTPTKGFQGLVAKDSLCYVDGSKFFINGTGYDLNLTTDDAKPKTLISMGAYVIIMPDKKYINVLSPESDKGNIEAWKETSGEVKFTLSKADGSDYEKTAYGPSEPVLSDDMKNGKDTIPVWVDTSTVPNQLKQYSSATETWNAIATTYVRIESTGIGVPFAVNDGVTISGITNSLLSDLNTSTVILARGENYIVVTGIIDKVEPQTTPICVSRWMPDFDFIVESQNRLWGCKYGFVYKGMAAKYDGEEYKGTVPMYSTEVVNEIYACKLGDFKNWNCFMGISTDSYVASVGTDGEFTGAVTHLGYPLFFKENGVHKVYGNYPSNYQIQTTACRGVQKECEKSLAIVNEVLYYKARSGVCAYDGSLPMEISSALGDVAYYDAVAGSLGNKYYISMKDDPDDNRGWNLFLYDTLKGMWHREDDTQAMAFCNCRGDLYYIELDKHGQRVIKTVRGTGVAETEPIEWEAVTGILGTDSPDKKYISKLDVRMSLTVGSRAMFFIEYDSSGEWDYLFAMDGISLKSFPVPIKPQRCDHMRLKIVGVGEAKIFSICKTIEQGSDV
jgi:hypothetical protein